MKSIGILFVLGLIAVDAYNSPHVDDSENKYIESLIKEGEELDKQFSVEYPNFPKSILVCWSKQHGRFVPAYMCNKKEGK